MVNLTATSADDLLCRVGAIDIAVPPRTKGRTTEQCERWSICRFLSTYAETDLLQYPLQIEKRERPDFLLSLPSSSIGIEMTEAVPPDWAWADARREKLSYEKLVFLQRFRPAEPRRSKQEIDDIARGASRGDGWAGDAPEREWADAMLHFADEKTDKFQKPGYEQFKTNWLLIYDNWPLPAVQDQKAAAFLAQRLASLDMPLPFDSIFVECENSIWQFRASGYVPQPIRDLWTDS
jgi:hypothetical protein